MLSLSFLLALNLIGLLSNRTAFRMLWSVRSLSSPSSIFSLFCLGEIAIWSQSSVTLVHGSLSSRRRSRACCASLSCSILLSSDSLSSLASYYCLTAKAARRACSDIICYYLSYSFCSRKAYAIIYRCSSSSCFSYSLRFFSSFSLYISASSSKSSYCSAFMSFGTN